MFGRAIGGDDLLAINRPMIGLLSECPGHNTLQYEARHNGPDWPYAGRMPDGFNESSVLEDKYFVSMCYMHAVQQQNFCEYGWREGQMGFCANWGAGDRFWSLVGRFPNKDLDVRIPRDV